MLRGLGLSAEMFTTSKENAASDHKLTPLEQRILKWMKAGSKKDKRKPLTNAQEKHIMDNQNRRCANTKDINMVAEEFYECPMWKLYDGVFDKSNYHLDHKIPIQMGGSSAEDNYQALCVCCHAVKSKKEMRLMQKMKEYCKTYHPELVPKVDRKRKHTSTEQKEKPKTALFTLDLDQIDLDQEFPIGENSKKLSLSRETSEKSEKQLQSSFSIVPKKLPDRKRVSVAYKQVGVLSDFDGVPPWKRRKLEEIKVRQSKPTPSSTITTSSFTVDDFLSPAERKIIAIYDWSEKYNNRPGVKTEFDTSWVKTVEDHLSLYGELTETQEAGLDNIIDKWHIKI